METNFLISDIKCKIIAHKYAVEINRPELEKPFKMIVQESFRQDTGESIGWTALPEIQLRQTINLKQEYIISNVNSKPKDAISECLFKMMMTDGREMYYPDWFEEKYNRLWNSENKSNY